MSDHQNKSDSQRNTQPHPKVPSADSFLLEHGNIKSNQEAYTPKALPPRMREVVQENTTKLLKRIRNLLKEFTRFVEEMQRKRCSERQESPIPSFPEAPKPCKSTIFKPLQPVDPRPKNAALRDAFLMVKNLLGRISNVIDEVAASIPAEDDQRRDVQSPHFDYYYAQYVFQLAFYILWTVGDELEEFSKVLDGISADEILNKLPSKIDEITTIHLHQAIRPVKSESPLYSEETPGNSETSGEENSSDLDYRVSDKKLRKQAMEALELLSLISKRMVQYFEDKALPEFSETQQEEYSRRALGIPELCKHCTRLVARKLRRYKSRENLYLEKYENSSADLSPKVHQKDSPPGLHLESVINPKDVQSAPTPVTCQRSVSTQISATETKVTRHRLCDLFQRKSHKDPLINDERESIAMANQMKQLGETTVSVITVTKDSGEREKTHFREQSDQINFNLHEFCVLLKEHFKKLLSEKNYTSLSQTAESNIIANALIQCFRDASTDIEEQPKQYSVRFGDVDQILRDSDSIKKATEAYEKRLHETAEKFVNDTLKLVIDARKRRQKETLL